MANIVAIDTSHLLYRHFYAIVGKKPASRITKRDLEQARQNAMDEIDEYRKRLKPTDKIITAFDDRVSWRKHYTTQHGLPEYKHNRKKGLKPRQKRVNDVFLKFRTSFKSDMKRDKDVTMMFGKHLEADDLLAGLARNKKKGDKLSIVSLDHDMRQLNHYDNVQTIDMSDGRVFKQSKAESDFQRFNRSIRGRSSYNVGQILSRVSEQEMREMYENPMLLESRLDDEDAKKAFRHNRVLFDMVDQPKAIQRQVDAAIKKSYK